MTKAQSTDIKKYHWMVSAQVVFTIPGSEDGSVLMMNTMLLTDEPVVTYKDLARANHSLKVSLDQRLQATVVLKDIIIVAASNLGLMSQPEFEAGMVKQGA